MENNSDKEMRDKLQNMEFPYDPKAWAQMETMLNEKTQPKRFFWWWFSGVAAGLFIAALLGYRQFERGPGIATNTVAGSTPVIISQSSSVVSPLANVTVNPTGVGAVPGSKANNMLRNAVQNPAASSNFQVTKRNGVQPVSPPKLSQAGQDNFIFATAKNQAPGKAHSSQSKGKIRVKGTSTGTGQIAKASTNSKQTNSQPASSTAYSGTGAVASTGETPALLDPATLAFQSGFEFGDETNPALPLMKKDEEDVNLKKLKKKIFNYSIGVLANVSGATLGHQKGAGSSNEFYGIPSYMAGITQDFMFFKRFAITNAILFSQTSFKVFTSDPNYLPDYSSTITELAIPIGVKGYAVSKPHFRFYLGAGITTHIKLKEAFNGFTNFGQNNFSPQAGNLPQTLGIVSVGDPYNSYAGLSINQSRQFYTSFYASAGAEFILQKHAVFFAEPVFDMTNQKIGSSGKYKYDLGLSGGFRYQF